MNNYKLSGDTLLNTPQFNKGTAFTNKERRQFKLIGRLPYRVETLAMQVNRAYQQYLALNDYQQKNLFLNELHNTNQVLFYKLAATHLEEMTPVIYTPHVATFCKTFSAHLQRPYGLYISYPDRNYLAEILANRPLKNVALIVVTDGERILGIGDQGVGGIGIPIGKLMLYSLFGGIDPLQTLPIVLDVGTNNPEHLTDPNYLGWRHRRISGEKYDKFIAAFVNAVKHTLPRVFLQWEDFGKNNALRILQKYRDKICSFNDDIQGTAVVTLAALLSALKVTKQKLITQRIVILGAGSAATGIAAFIVQAMIRHGMTESAARCCFWLVDIDGLITAKTPNLTSSQKPFARAVDVTAKSLLEVVHTVQPTILLGCSTAAKAFTQQIIQEMAKHVAQPIIFPLSNPTANSEADPKDLIKWTKGRALIATGSPYAPVTYNGKNHAITQCNNALSFPGIGLGAIASKAKKVSDEMLWVACQTLHTAASGANMLLPAIKDAAKIARRVGYNVAKQAQRENLAALAKNADLRKVMRDFYWRPG